jgi:hypothetical protein
MSTREPEATPDPPADRDQLARDTSAFGTEVANAVQAELEGEASEERLDAIRKVFMQAADHIEKRFGFITGTKWMEQVDLAMRRRMAEPSDGPSDSYS